MTPRTKNFDAATTIRQNLSTYDPETKRLYKAMGDSCRLVTINSVKALPIKNLRHHKTLAGAGEGLGKAGSDRSIRAFPIEYVTL